LNDSKDWGADEWADAAVIAGKIPKNI